MRIQIVSLLATAALLAAAPASAFEMGALNPLLDTGKDGAWDQRDEDGFFILDNDGNNGAVRYYFVNPRDGEAGRRKVSVEIDLRDETEWSRGGILYAFKANPKSYFTFTLDADGSISVFEINNGKLERRVQSKRDSVTDGVNTLTLIEDGKLIKLFINDEALPAFGNDRMGQGGVGIVAWEPGEYAFRNFKIELVDK